VALGSGVNVRVAGLGTVSVGSIIFVAVQVGGNLTGTGSSVSIGRLGACSSDLEQLKRKIEMMINIIVFMFITFLIALPKKRPPRILR
jgi:hypothetical protein